MTEEPSGKASPLQMLRPGNLRAWMSDHPAIALSVVMAGLVAAVLFGAYRLVHMGAKEVAQAYFVNEQTLATEVRSTLEVPPIVSKNGELVYGVYMACGDCANKQLVYLQKYSPEGKQALEQYIRAHGEPPSPLEFGGYAGVPLVRGLQKDAPWVRAGTPEAAEAINSLQCPAGVNRYPCFAH